jgi:hypothetical protein
VEKKLIAIALPYLALAAGFCLTLWLLFRYW